MKTEKISGRTGRNSHKIFRVTAALFSAAMVSLLFTAALFRGNAFAAPATMSNATEAGAQGEVFVSPDFIWNEETPGEFQIRFTITNGSDTVIPETEVRITLPDPALRFDTEASFSGQEPASGRLTADEGELLLELSDFQVGEIFAVSASGNTDPAVIAEITGNADHTGMLRNGTNTVSGRADTLPDRTEEQSYSPGAMNVSLVLRGYGEEHPTALDYPIPDLVPETEEAPEEAEEVPETRTLILLSASLTGTGRDSVAADIVDVPLSRTLLLMNKNDEYSMDNIHYQLRKEAGGSSDRPFSMIWLIPFMTAGSVLLILYILYCIWDVQRRAKAFKFDPLLKKNEKR